MRDEIMKDFQAYTDGVGNRHLLVGWGSVQERIWD